MPNVFIPNKGSHDYSDSERYGFPIFVSTGVLEKFSVFKMLNLWEEALGKSKKEDYILLSSLHVMECIGCGLFAAKHGVLNLLLYKKGKYLARSLDLKKENKDERGT